MDFTQRTMTPIESQTNALHAAFQRLTAQKVTLSYQRKLAWSQFIAREFTELDLELLIKWLKVQIARGEGGFSPLSLQFGALLGDVDKFEDRLNVARQSKLGRAISGRVGVPPAGAGILPTPSLDPTAEQALRDRGRKLSEEVRKQIGGQQS